MEVLGVMINTPLAAVPQHWTSTMKRQRVTDAKHFLLNQAHSTQPHHEPKKQCHGTSKQRKRPLLLSKGIIVVYSTRSVKVKE